MARRKDKSSTLIERITSRKVRPLSVREADLRRRLERIETQKMIQDLRTRLRSLRVGRRDR